MNQAEISGSYFWNNLRFRGRQPVSAARLQRNWPAVFARGPARRTLRMGAVFTLCFGLAFAAFVSAGEIPAKTTRKVPAAPAKKSAGPRMDELSIQADTAEVDFAEHTAVFTGNVHVEDTDMVLDADKMTIYLREKREENELKRIEAEGNVRIRETGSDRVATAGKAVYDVAKDTITLSESPSLIESGKGMMTEADSFVYYRTARKFIATGRPKFTVLVKKGKGAAHEFLGSGDREKKSKGDQ